LDTIYTQHDIPTVRYVPRCGTLKSEFPQNGNYLIKNHVRLRHIVLEAKLAYDCYSTKFRTLHIKVRVLKLPFPVHGKGEGDGSRFKLYKI